MNRILIEIAPGELLDRITILQLKLEHAGDRQKQARFRRELDVLAAAAEGLPDSRELRALLKQLGDVNRRLWSVEDQLRACERRGDFGTRFIELARSVYRDNDRRALLRGRINHLLQVDASDEKVYTD